MDDLERSLLAHPFLRDLAPEHARFLVGCAKNARFAPGDYLMKEGQDEHALFLVRRGCVALEVTEPGREPVVVETVGPGDVLGVSWLFRGHATHLDCRARESTVCFELDGDCIKKKMEADPALGYALTSRLLERVYDRLARARLQKLDVYR